jgi:hypothetical protein
MKVLGINAGLPRPGRGARRRRRHGRRGGGGALLAPQARQDARCPFSTWELPELRRPGAWRGGLRPRTSTRSPTPTTRRSRRPAGGHHRRRVGGPAHALRRARAALPARPSARASTRRGPLGAPPRRARGVGDLASGWDPCSVLVLDGRGERGSHLAGAPSAASSRCWPPRSCPHSLGLLYEELTAHLGFRRSSDEYKVMAMASYGEPRSSTRSASWCARRRGRLRRRRRRLRALRPALGQERRVDAAHADLASHRAARSRRCCSTSRPGCTAHGRPRPGHGGRRGAQLRGELALWREGPFERIWVQPGGGRLGHGARRRAARRARARRPRRPDADRRARPRAGTTTSCELAAHGRRRVRAPDDMRRRVAEVIAATASSPGSRAARSSARARSGTGR